MLPKNKKKKDSHYQQLLSELLVSGEDRESFTDSHLISLLDSKIGRPFDILLIKDQNGNFLPALEMLTWFGADRGSQSGPEIQNIVHEATIGENRQLVTDEPVEFEK